MSVKENNLNLRSLNAWNNLKTRFLGFLKRERLYLLLSFASVFVLGLIAHGYCFSNLALAHDALAEWNCVANASAKIALGRFIAPIYQIITTGKVVIPWLTGLLSLLWLSISTWLIVKIFCIKSKIAIIFIAGILTLNPSVCTLASTFIHDLDADLFAVLMAIVAARLWQINKKSLWLGILPLFIVFGIYQAMISVFLILVIMICISNLIHKLTCKKVFIHGLKAFAVIIIAGVLYLVFVKLTCTYFGIELSSSDNSIGHISIESFLPLILSSYSQLLFGLLHYSVWKVKLMALLCAVLLITFLVCLFLILKRKNLAVSNKIFILLLIVVTPPCLNVSYILDGGRTHSIMCFSYFFLFIALILLVHYCYNTVSSRYKICLLINKIIAICFVLITFFCWTQTANELYLYKDLNQKATLSTMTEVMHDLDSTPGYVAGKTPVYFIGKPCYTEIGEFAKLQDLFGANESVISYIYTYINYFNLILQRPINLLYSENIDQQTLQNAIQNQPSFPNKGYIAWSGNMLLVKMNDTGRFAGWGL